MNLRDSLDRVQAVELKRAAVEAFCEVAVAREVLLLDLETSRSAVAVVHVVGLVGRRANVETVVWIC